MTKLEMEVDRKTNIRNKGVSKVDLATLNKVEINGKKTRPALEQALDKVCLLYKSKLFGKLDTTLDEFMIEYHELPEEEQIRQLPFEVKEAIRKEFLEPMKQQAEYYATYRKDAREPLYINDEDDTKKYVLDVDYLKDSKETIVDFPYQSIVEIIKSDEYKALSSSQKIAMVDKYMALKLKAEESTEPIEMILEFKEKPKSIEEGKTTKQMWDTLKQKYKRDRAVKRLLWEHSKKKDGTLYKYIPYVITVNPAIVDSLSKKYIADVNVHYENSSIFINEDSLRVYIFWVRKSEIGNLPTK